MSNTPFLESLSDDPVERAIARKVQRILNDRTLDRPQREQRVRQAQRELITHRRHKQSQQTLRDQVAALPLPEGFKPHSVQVRNGRVHLATVSRRHGFVWLDAGHAPQGAASNEASFALPGNKATGRRVRKSLQQAIEERRKALGLGAGRPAQG